MDIQESTPLAVLPIRHLETVLDEIFLVPPSSIFPDYPQPSTVGELAQHARLTLAEVVTRLRRIAAMSDDVEITCEDLAERLAAEASTLPILLDVREDWEFQVCHLPGSLHLRRCDLGSLLPSLQAAPLVVTVCHHGVRSYSAALFLKTKGVANVRSLAGGVDEWARTIDTSLARY